MAGVPYVAGVYALAVQTDLAITLEDFCLLALKTVCTVWTVQTVVMRLEYPLLC